MRKLETRQVHHRQHKTPPVNYFKPFPVPMSPSRLSRSIVSYSFGSASKQNYTLHSWLHFWRLNHQAKIFINTKFTSLSGTSRFNLAGHHRHVAIETITSLYLVRSVRDPTGISCLSKLRLPSCYC